MSDVSYLETLSNKDLHKKCLEYGLPNIPVTDGSRQVILKRLQNTILGTQKKSPSLKVVHKSTVSPDVSKKVSSVATKTPSRNCQRTSNCKRRTVAEVPTHNLEKSTDIFKKPDPSYLDTLSNKELHKKCLEYGLPNIPVADGSRQVILRRLRAAIAGKPAIKNHTAPKKKDTSKLTPTATKKNIEGGASGTCTSRRSQTSNYGRRTIVPVPNNPLTERKIETTTTISDEGSQSEEDDDSNEKIIANDKARRNRNVTFAKSEVLTTSNTGGEHQKLDMSRTYTYERPRAANAHTLPSYCREPIQERTFRPDVASLSQKSQFLAAHKQMPQNYMPRYTFTGSTSPFGSGAGGLKNSTQGSRQTTGTSSRGFLTQSTTTSNALYPTLSTIYHNIAQNPVEPMDISIE